MVNGQKIVIRGAKQHNLKDVSLELPRDRMIVVTGVSGSGKSSLAFDTIFAEGQRRYVESLSAYARQFLEQMEKPDVEAIEGLPPTISIEQRAGNPTPRSTVATSTEIYDYLRLLFARVGRPFCHKCKTPITQQTPQQITDAIMEFEDGVKFMVLAPVARGKKGTHLDTFQQIKREGFVRVRVDGVIAEIKDVYALDKNKRHTIEVVVDRLVMDRVDVPARLADSIETSLRLSHGLVSIVTDKEEKLYSELYACAECGLSFGELQPRLFSFNSPYGACTECGGLGTKLKLDEDLIVPHKELSLRDGAIEPWKRLGKRMTIRYNRRLREFGERYKVKLSTPFEKIAAETRKILLNGNSEFEGVIPNLYHRFEVTESDFVKWRIMGYMSEVPCPECKGARLKPESLSVLVGGKNIRDVTTMTVDVALEYFQGLSLTKEERQIARRILKEIVSRLTFLNDVGLAYLTLDRRSSTLAGGESQRIRLASQVGSGLVGVCYVLDEPTIGLHARDNQRLLATLLRLRDLGNTVIVVEHDEETIEAADLVVDVGPGAGIHGGTIVAQGTLEEIKANPASLTGKFFSGEERIEVPRTRRKATGEIRVIGASENNLKQIDAAIPVGTFTCVTGVSGSGKSTLVEDIVHKGLKRLLMGGRERPGAHQKIVGSGQLTRVAVVDQSPIGRTPRSNPATYTGAFDEIRSLYAMTKEAKMRGYKPGRFSFNVKGGRCEACEGQGTKVIEMHFLPDVYVTCEACRGTRYNRETLEVLYRQKSIADVLAMSVEEALKFFAAHPKIARIVETLDSVGLGYVKLGQASTTLSGGEAQRVKLAAELIPRENQGALYILDEPTTGLHFADIRKLLSVLNTLVDKGNTVLVIEHNLHVVKCADWVIDLGPEGGDGGGRIVAVGTPEEVAKVEGSHTGRILRGFLKGRAVAAGR